MRLHVKFGQINLIVVSFVRKGSRSNSILIIDNHLSVVLNISVQIIIEEDKTWEKNRPNLFLVYLQRRNFVFIKA